MSPKHLSLALTVLIALLVVSVVFNVHLSTKKELAEQLYELTAEEALEEEEVPEEEMQETTAQEIKTNRSYNELRKSLQRELEEFKTLDELREEAKQSEASEVEEDAQEDTPSEQNASTGRIAMNTANSKKSLASNGNDSSEITAANAAANRNSSISFSLVDRMARGLLPNPTYTCMRSGKVVVNIKVNQFGEVYEATINAASSTSERGCHIDNALAYALRAKFNATPGKTSQIGTITYYFQAK